MIVQASGDSLVRNYAVLGDDVIVSDDAPRYLELMTGFGVGISLAKSICSNEFIEFAKRVRTLKGEDYSIIGPGLIMAAVRNRFLSAVALADSIRKDLIR
jgi:ribosomal protein S13